MADGKRGRVKDIFFFQFSQIKKKEKMFFFSLENPLNLRFDIEKSKRHKKIFAYALIFFESIESERGRIEELPILYFKAYLEF